MSLPPLATELPPTALRTLSRARPLATREVQISAGQVHDPAATLRAVPSRRAEASA